eukprot:433643_1
MKDVFYSIYIISGFIVYLGPGIQFVFYAAKLNQRYKKFIVDLWSYDCEIMDVSHVTNIDALNQSMIQKYDIQSSNETSEILLNIKNYHFLLQYVNSHKLKAKIMGMEITKTNAAKFVVMFLFLKIISYSIYNIKNQ